MTIFDINVFVKKQENLQIKQLIFITDSKIACNVVLKSVNCLRSFPKPWFLTLKL
jgi:hypothetical protein